MFLISNYLNSAREAYRFAWKNQEYRSKHGAPVSIADSNGLGSIVFAAVDANGAVITMSEGQTQVSFTLVQEGDVTQDASMEISASYAGQDASATSNAWSVNLKDGGETAKTFTGDQRAKRIGIEIDLGTLPSIPAYGSYKWSAVTWAEDGTLNGGLEEADFNDVIRGTAANDKIAGLGGADALDGGAGNDQIDGGAGDDLIAGGAGSDDIKGGDGNDVIFSSATLFAPQRNKPSDSWSAPAGYSLVSAGSKDK